MISALRASISLAFQDHFKISNRTILGAAMILHD